MYVSNSRVSLVHTTQIPRSQTFSSYIYIAEWMQNYVRLNSSLLWHLKEAALQLLDTTSEQCQCYLEQGVSLDEDSLYCNKLDLWSWDTGI